MSASLESAASARRLLILLLRDEIERLDALAHADLRTEGRRPIGVAHDEELLYAAAALFALVAARAAIDAAELASGRDWIAAADAKLREIESGAGADERASCGLTGVVGEALFAVEQATHAIAAIRARRSSLPPPPASVLTIESEGRWFTVDGGPRVELRRRQTLARLLSTLAACRRDSPGRCLSPEELIAAAWPGERIIPKAAKNRLYFAVHELRSLGLRDVVLTRDDGYFVSPLVEVHIEREERSLGS